ncbi:hypothetical protein Acsp03_47340 [Actinomadura sp. NBRC 104412]|uniref:hypothetical protein n=1 Tax=Actinomadura sp. NBRC 104412 TaxID=3032203 RepID=UPI0024A57379|nr:hypothetical protein [Actinomadura sp. NBRC 104412]GLZ07268.1 hypothetical protein Acsp03_47340 [Actinomadura sp. NBRC 104412]
MVTIVPPAKICGACTRLRTVPDPDADRYDYSRPYAGTTLTAARGRATALVWAAVRVRAGELSMDGLVEVFRRSVVYCEAAEGPGFVVRAGVVPVFSSLLAVAQVLGGVSWFGASGRDVLGQLPGGYRVRLDPGTPHEVSIPAVGA